MKIPLKLKGTHVICGGHFAVFTDSFLKGTSVITELYKKEKSKGLPCMGQISFKGIKYYWCRYGFVDDPDIYTKYKRK